MIDNGLDLEFLFSIDDVWGRPREVVSILMGFPERRQKTGVEDIVNSPGRG